MPPPSCVSLFNAVCNTFNLPPRPPSSALCASIPRATFEEGGPFLVFLATRVFALLARHACSRIRCPLYDYAFVFCSIFFFPRFIFTSFPPSFLCKYSARSYFCFSSPLPPLFPSSSPSPTLENKMRERCREGEVGRRGFQPLEPREPGRGEGEKGE